MRLIFFWTGEKNKIEPGMLFTGPTRLAIKMFNWVERMTIEHTQALNKLIGTLLCCWGSIP